MVVGSTYAPITSISAVFDHLAIVEVLILQSVCGALSPHYKKGSKVVPNAPYGTIRYHLIQTKTFCKSVEHMLVLSSSFTSDQIRKYVK